MVQLCCGCRSIGNSLSTLLSQWGVEQFDASGEETVFQTVGPAPPAGLAPLAFLAVGDSVHRMTDT